MADIAWYLVDTRDEEFDRFWEVSMEFAINKVAPNITNIWVLVLGRPRSWTGDSQYAYHNYL